MSCPSQKGATANKIRHKQECMWIATCTCFKVFAPHLPARKYCKYFFGQQSVTKLAMQQTEEEKNLQTSASLATLHELQNNTLGPCFICSCISIRDVLTCLFIMQAVVVFTSTFVLLWSSGERAVNESTQIKETQARERVLAETTIFFSTPVQLLTETNTLSKSSMFDITNRKHQSEWFISQAIEHGTVDLIGSCDTTGYMILAVPDATQQSGVTISFSSPSNYTILNMYATSSNLSASSFIQSYVHVTGDGRGRPWFQSAATTLGTVWTDTFSRGEGRGFAIAVSDVLYAKNATSRDASQIHIVTTVFIRLATIANFLAKLANKFENSTLAFIVERKSGYLMGAWTGAFQRIVDGKQARIPANDSEVPIVQKIGIELSKSSFSISKPKPTDILSGETNYNSSKYSWTASPYQDNFGIDCVLVIVLEQRNFVDKVIQAGVWAIAVCVACIVAGSVLLCIVSQWISYSLWLVAKQVFDLSNLNNIRLDSRHLSILYEVRLIQRSIIVLQRGLELFQKYIPVDVVKAIISHKKQRAISIVAQEMTILFIDIADFTTIVEQHSAETLVSVLSDFFSAATAICTKHKGAVDKFIGDAVMIMYNHPYGLVDNHESCAVRTAIDFLHELKTELHKNWKDKQLPLLHARIGIHSGGVLVGNLGSTTRINYTAIGDTVNLAARLEGANKHFGTQILMGEETWNQSNAEFLCLFVDIIVVKGKTQSTSVFSPICVRHTARMELKHLESQLLLLRSAMVQEDVEAIQKLLPAVSEANMEYTFVTKLVHRLSAVKSKEQICSHMHEK